MPGFLTIGPATSPITLLLAHGAGAPMTSAFLDAVSDAAAANQITTSRFEFDYMAQRRLTGIKRPPPKIDRLANEFRTQVKDLRLSPTSRLFVGGKSMGGRMASLIADELYASGRIAGLICLGYPFHPIGRPESQRTAHLAMLTCPTLIVQGDRDPLGNRCDVERYHLSQAISIVWLTDGDHDFKTRKASGVSQAAHISTAAAAIKTFAMAHSQLPIG